MIYLAAVVAWISGLLCGMGWVEWRRMPADLYAEARALIERAKLSEVSENAGLYSDEPAIVYIPSLKEYREMREEYVRRFPYSAPPPLES